MIIAYIVGVLLGGWLALWFIWQIITMLVRFIYYLTHRKQIKEEKRLSKKENELHQWQRRQWVEQMEEKKRKEESGEAERERQEKYLKEKERDRREAIEHGIQDWYEDKYGETVEGKKIRSED